MLIENKYGKHFEYHFDGSRQFDNYANLRRTAARNENTSLLPIWAKNLVWPIKWE